MYGFQIAKLLSRVDHIYKNLDGIVSLENLPKHVQIRKFLIINNKQHWLLLFRKSRHHFEIFDSLGQITADFVKKHFPYYCNYDFNTTQLQSDTSKTCGNFIIYTITHRLFNLDLSYGDFLNTFFLDRCEANEILVQQFIKQIKKGKFIKNGRKSNFNHL